MSDPNFIHLRFHSEYSLIDSVIRIDEILDKARDNNMPALGISDHNNFFATIKFYKAALAEGIKPIIGIDLLMANAKNASESFLISLFCQNQQGFRELSEIISKAYIEGQQLGIPRILRQWLTPNNCQHLIALQNYQSQLHDLLKKQSPELEQYQLFLQDCFPQRHYIELSRTGKTAEQEYEPLALAFAQRYNIPLVATNDIRFLSVDDYEAHEARVCIHDGAVLTDAKRVRKYSEQQYFRSTDEMRELFSDLPSALSNSVEIAKRCNLILSLDQPSLPNYPTGTLSTEAYLVTQSETGLRDRLNTITTSISAETYTQRLATELKVITQMGFSGYFLIVADFIAWSKENDIPVGPGRGSGAGSLVAYALGITDIDPLPYDLLFERFLNPERVSMPDFDIDFCMDGRDRVIDYVATKYGRESVSQIITYGSMAAKAVVRDVGRALAHPYGFVDKIAKLIPFELGITLTKALEQEAELKKRYDNEEEVKTLLDLALKLEGLVRNAGKHAGGVVIAPAKLTEFTPLYCEANGENLVSQFDKDDVESVGLVKFDFLGLRTLTIIDWAIKNILKRPDHQVIDIRKIPLDDPATYELLQQAQTTAVFQLESRGMKDLIKRLQPDCFEDIIALVALFRPGPLQSGMVDDFIQRKHGAQIEYPHPALETILKPTYGIILYQEQVMQIAQVLAGYTLGAADLLRRAMGKKKAEEMAEQRAIFTEGAKQRGIEESVATHIFDLMEKFAGYGFNKSHSAAYALLSYQTAWLKTHYPAEFMAAVLSSDMDNTDKVVTFIRECQAMKQVIMPPNINQGQFQFTVQHDDNNGSSKIIYGLGAVKGSGEAAISGMIEERGQNGAYQDLFDFCARNDLRKINKRVLEAAIKSGSFDCFGMNRATLWATLDKACLHAEQKASMRAQGQSDLFGLHMDQATEETHHYVLRDKWPLMQKLQGEQETLGWYLSGHPLSAYQKEAKQFKTTKINELYPQPDKTIKVIAQLVALRTLMTKRGDRMAIATFEDETGKIDSALFSEEFEKSRGILRNGEILLIEGIVEHDTFTNGIRMSTKKISSMAEARQWQGKALIIKANSNLRVKLLSDTMKQLLQQHPGNFPVIIRYHHAQAQIDCRLGAQWCINPCDELLQSLSALIGTGQVEVNFG
jgi:DNA polymerase-3 subunit alpha